jgi:hypothetical protein
VAGLLEEAVKPLLETPLPPDLPPQYLGALACVARRLGYSRWEAWALLYAARMGSVGEQRYLYTPQYEGVDDLRNAGLLALTEPALGRHWLEAALRRLGGMEKLSGDVPGQAVAAAAALDPDWAQQLLTQIPLDRRGQNGLARVAAEDGLVRALLQTPEKHEQQVLKNSSGGDWLLPVSDEMPNY